jgi:hypothetical protein
MKSNNGDEKQAARNGALLHRNIRRAETESVMIAVVEAMSEVAGTPPEELPPLYNTIDVEALEKLFAQRGDGPNPSLSATFTYHDYRVTVEDGVTVAIYPPT